MENEDAEHNGDGVPKMNKDKKLTPSLPSGFLDYKGDTLELKKSIIKIIESKLILYISCVV